MEAATRLLNITFLTHYGKAAWQDPVWAFWYNGEHDANQP
jgi:hypothetical protein